VRSPSCTLHAKLSSSSCFAEADVGLDWAGSECSTRGAVLSPLRMRRARPAEPASSWQLESNSELQSTSASSAASKAMSISLSAGDEPSGDVDQNAPSSSTTGTVAPKIFSVSFESPRMSASLRKNSAVSHLGLTLPPQTSRLEPPRLPAADIGRKVSESEVADDGRNDLFEADIGRLIAALAGRDASASGSYELFATPGHFPAVEGRDISASGSSDADDMPY